MIQVMDGIDDVLTHIDRKMAVVHENAKRGEQVVSSVGHGTGRVYPRRIRVNTRTGAGTGGCSWTHTIPALTREPVPRSSKSRSGTSKSDASTSGRTLSGKDSRPLFAQA